ncbi:hypothetical protein [Nostoc sp.]
MSIAVPLRTLVFDASENGYKPLAIFAYESEAALAGLLSIACFFSA